MVQVIDPRPQGYQMINDALAQFRDRAAQEDQIRKNLLIAYMAGQPFERRNQIFSQNPGISGGVHTIAYQPTDEEALSGQIAQKNAGILNNFAPDPFQQSYIATDLMLGRNPNADYTKLLGEKSYLNPPNFDASQLVSANLAPDANTMFKQITPTPTDAATIEKTRAETAKLTAETEGIKGQNAFWNSFDSPTGEMPQIVKDIANRDFDPSLMRRWKPEQVAAIEAAVKQVDPGFNMGDYANQVSTKKSFASGDAAKSVRSINQLIGHLQNLKDAGKAINNSDFLPIITNTVGNAIAGQLNPKMQKSLAEYNKAADAVANETETMLRGSSISGIDERKKVREALGQNISPSSLDGAINMTLRLMASRLQELDDQYTKGVGRMRDFTVLNPESSKILRAFGIDPTKIDPLSQGKNTDQKSGGVPAIGKTPAAQQPAPVPIGQNRQQGATQQMVTNESDILNLIRPQANQPAAPPAASTGSVSYDPNYKRGANNNPLNIKTGGLTKKWIDQGVATVDANPALDGGNFLKFNSVRDGLAAAQDLLRSPAYANLPVDAALNKWSNGGYTAAELGLPQFGSVKITDLDPSKLALLVSAMAHRESGMRMR